MALRFHVTLICPIAKSLLAEDLLRLLPPQAGDFLHGPEVLEPLDGRPHHVDGVAGADDLGENVPDARGLQHGAHRAAGDDARTLAGRLQQHLRAAKARLHLVGDGGPHHGHVDQVLLRVLDALADGVGHLFGLPLSGADVPVAVAYHHYRRKGARPSALPRLGDGIDVVVPFLQLGEVASIDSLASQCHETWASAFSKSRPPARAPSANAATRAW